MVDASSLFPGLLLRLIYWDIIWFFATLSFGVMVTNSLPPYWDPSSYGEYPSHTTVTRQPYHGKKLHASCAARDWFRIRV